MIAVSRHCWALERLGGFANADRDFFDLEDFLRPYIIPISYTHEPSPFNTPTSICTTQEETCLTLTDLPHIRPTSLWLPCDYSSHAMIETSDQHNI